MTLQQMGIANPESMPEARAEWLLKPMLKATATPENGNTQRFVSQRRKKSHV